MSYVALEELCQIWENNPDEVIVSHQGYLGSGGGGYRLQMLNRKPKLQTGVLDRRGRLPGREVEPF